MPTFPFPLKGKHTGTRAGVQIQGTSRDLNNVRPYYDGRLAGGQRPALDKWGAGTQIGSAEQPVVAMCIVGAIA